MKQDLEIYENGAYKNIYLKTKYKRDKSGNIELSDGKKIPLFRGLDDGNHVLVEKTGFIEGRKIEKPTYTLYSCQVKYKEQVVSFVLYETEHSLFASCGGIGDAIKISLKKEFGVNRKTGVEQVFERLSFTKMDKI